MNQPFFSIIIPTFNRQNCITNCIKSVLKQSFENFELLIIDNNSTDNTIKLANQIPDTRIKVFINEKNFERCYSRNKGINISNGKYVLFLDSDDLLEQDHLQNWFEFLSNIETQKSFFICQKKILNENNKLIRSDFFNYQNIKDLIDFPVIPGQICIPIALLKNHHFNSNYLIFEDTALWLQLAMEYNFISAKFDSYVYVINENNSVNIKNDFGKTRYLSIKSFIKENPHIVKKVGEIHFKKELSNSLFQSAKYYIAQQQNKKALIFIIKSFLIFKTKFQLKHKLFLITKLLTNSNIKEYRIR